MGLEYRKIVRGRKLAERSYLYFKYPTKGDPVEFYLPFMENITISESQRPNLVTYDLIGRSSNLFSYLGSKSREIQLKFYITLPNIIDYIYNVGLSELFSDNFRSVILGINNYQERDKFFKYDKDLRTTKDSIKFDGLGGKFDYYSEATEDMSLLDENFSVQTGKNLLEGLKNFFTTEPWGLGKLTAPEPEIKKGFPEIQMNKAVNYLMMWVNVIRTSVINNSTKTQYGPPTIYVNHGTMYNNIPCVCSNYSIRLVEEAGYDLLSLAPRRVEVTMQLLENRVGNFEKFVPFKETVSDNLTGWEAIFNEPGTMDPNSQFLRHYRDRQRTGVMEYFENLEKEMENIKNEIFGPL